MRSKQVGVLSCGVILRVEVTFIDQEAARVLRMLSEAHSAQLINCSHEPRSRGIDLAVAGLEKQHTGVSCSSKQLQTLLRKLHPQLACLRSTLQEGGCYV